MVRKGDRSIVMEDRCEQTRSTLKKVQIQLGLVDENATEAEFRRYDHDQRVVQRLLKRLHGFYLIKAFERFGIFIEHDLAIIHSMLSDMPDEQTAQLREIASEKVRIFHK